MLAALVIGAITIFMVILRVSLGRFGKTPRRPRVFFLVAAVLAVLGAGLSVNDAIRLENLYAQKSWPTATGVIIDTGIKGERAFHPEVTYKYTVDSVTHTGLSVLRAPMFGNKRKKYDVAREILEKNHVGQSVTVHYNPNDPSESTLTPGPDWNVYAQLGVWGFLFAIGLFGITLPAKRGALPENDKAPSPVQ